MKKLLFSILFTSLLCVNAQRECVDLSGRWHFSMDAKSELLPTDDFGDFIDLPGSMPERQKGFKPTVDTRWTGSLYDSSYFFNPYMAKYRTEANLKLPFFLTPTRHYVGNAWYSRTVSVPASFRGKRVVLYLERPHISTILYINEREVGTRNSLSVAHEYDVTDYVKPGELATLCIRVNNDADKVGVGNDSHSVSDQTQGNWNGIVGKMELRALPATHIAHLDVFTDAQTKQVRLAVDVVRGGQQERDFVIQSAFSQSQLNKQVNFKGKQQKVILTADTTHVEFVVDCHLLQLWDEFHPCLANLTVSLVKGKKVADTYETRFGMRSIETRGKDILVNGRPTMMRGTVENCCFPLTGYPPTDKESWLNVFRKCKEYGLNHVRFHSYCPPEAAFEAADEVGIYLQPEGPSWPNHGIKLGNGMMIDKYLMEETERMVKDYGNHPSFAMLSSGNEPAGGWVRWVSRFVDYWRAKDNRRIYTGASVGGSWAWQPRNQYHVKAGARGLDWDKREPNTMDDFRDKIDTVSQPFISHETGQWCAFPDFKETELYTGVNKARNFEIFADILRDKGMSHMAEKFLMASGKVQALCYKYEIEKTLRTPHYAGFQLLGLNDYSGQGTALVGPLNVFWKEKGYVDAAEWTQFCSPVTLLARLPRFTFYEDESIPLTIELSNYGSSAVPASRLHLRFRAEGMKPLDYWFDTSSVPIGELAEIVKESVSLDCFAAPCQITLEASLSNAASGEGREVKNEWKLWLYPRHNQSETSTASLPALKDLYICKDVPGDEAKAVLDKGGKVLILASNNMKYGQGIVQQFTPVFWNTSWFKMRPPHTTGMFIQNEHPLFRYFPSEDFSDLQWWPLMNRQPLMLMGNMPKDLMPIVQPIDTWFLSRKLGMLFEAKVGKGKVLVTTMPLWQKKGNPAVEQMQHAVIQYMSSDDFRPSHALDWERITELFLLDTPPVNMFTNDSPDELKKGIR